MSLLIPIAGTGRPLCRNVSSRRWVPPKSLGISIARAIVFGDVDGARKLARGMRSLSVVEARAMLGAIRMANHWYGCSLELKEFLS